MIRKEILYIYVSFYLTIEDVYHSCRGYCTQLNLLKVSLAIYTLIEDLGGLCCISPIIVADWVISSCPVGKGDSEVRYLHWFLFKRSFQVGNSMTEKRGNPTLVFFSVAFLIKGKGQ